MVDGNKIRQKMEEKGISGVELADRVGVTPTMISYILRGMKNPSSDVFIRIAVELGCKTDDLVTLNK